MDAGHFLMSPPHHHHMSSPPGMDIGSSNINGVMDGETMGGGGNEHEHEHEQSSSRELSSEFDQVAGGRVPDSPMINMDPGLETQKIRGAPPGAGGRFVRDR